MSVDGPMLQLEMMPATPPVVDSSSSTKKLKLTLRPSKKLKYQYKTKPYSHQKKALNKIFRREGQCALFMEMGTGKTKVALDWAGIGYYNFGVRKVLVVAPLSVLGVWPRQIREHSSVPSRAFRLEGATRKRVQLLTRILRSPDINKLTYVIINYEGIWRDTDDGKSVEGLLIKWKPDLVIFDESHRLKSPTSKQSRSAARISREIPQRLILTGTPISKAPLDAFGQFRVVNEHIFGKGVKEDWYRFKNKYGVWGGFGKYQLKGYRHLDVLIKKVRDWSFRVRKKDCLDLPPKVYLDVPVTLSDKAQKLYRQMAKEMIIEIEETHATASIVLTKLLRLSQITSGFIKDVEGKIRVFDDSKLRAFSDLLDDVIEEGHKVVVFVRFIPDLERIQGVLEKKNIAYRKLDGSVPERKRDSNIHDFQTNPNVKVFVAQLQAGSEGIELYKADVAIYYSMGYSALHYWQSQDRLHRPGQTSDKVTYYRLIVPHSIDSITYQILQEKGNIARAVLHDPQILRP